MRKLTLYLSVVCIALSSCVSERLYEHTSQVADITYVSRPYHDKYGDIYYHTYAYFVLENGLEIPMPDNFNPGTAELCIGKTVTYYTYNKSEYKQQIVTTPTTPSEDDSAEGYKYICQKKYISDNKYIIKYYTKTNYAIKTVEVSGDVYERAKEGYYMETEDIEPFIQQRK